MSTERDSHERRRFLRAVGSVAVVGAMAGCGSDEGNGNGGNGNGGNGNGGNGNGGNGAGSDVWQPFAFSESGTYQWEIDDQGGEFNSLTMSVESVSDTSATVTATLDLGGVTQETTVSGTPSEIQEQLSTSVAGALLSTTYLAPPLAQSQGEAFSLDEEWSVQAGGETARMRVTGEDSYAGLSCRAWEYTVNEQVRMEGCVSTAEGLALYFETFDESGTSEFRMELVNYSSEPGDAADIGGGSEETGQESDDSADDGESMGDDTVGTPSSVWQPFAFNQPGTYEWTVDEEGDQFESLTMTVESVSGNTATVTAQIELDGATQETTVSGTPDEIRQQLGSSVAGVLLSVTYFAPPLAQSQGKSFAVGDEWSVQAGGESAQMRVTTEDTIGGLSCQAWEYTVNNQLRMEGCVNTEQGLALYFETYDENGTSEFRMELVNFTPG